MTGRSHEAPRFIASFGQHSIERIGDDLQRKGPVDQERHNEKVKEAIHSDPTIITREDIVTSDGTRSIHVPIRSLDLPHFNYGVGRRRVGTGPGQPGESIGKGAGSEPGGDFYEAPISLDEALAVIFEKLQLPDLEERGKRAIQGEKTIWNEVRRQGVMSNLDKKRTVMETLRRRARAGEPVKFKPTIDDLRFKTWNTDPDEDRSAVLFFMRDVSGSMGDFERYVTKIMSAYMVRQLRPQYKSLEVVFISHHATAKEVPEAEFFDYGESGGTIMSSAYKLAVEIMEQRYPWNEWNIYPFHWTDGFNFGRDDEKCAELVKKMLNEHHANLFGYIQTNNPGMAEHRRQGGANLDELTLRKALVGIGDPRVITTDVAEDTDMAPALRALFKSGNTEGAVSRA